MRSTVIAIAALLGGLAVSSAEAMPIPAVGTPAGVTTSGAPAVNVDYACGRGWHATPWGECRPNRWGPPPPRWGYRRPPPPPWGWHGHRHHRDDWREDRGWRDDGWRRRRDW
ncbi:GCG_CRPN prefix-to-repeats domain-containing protein [Rhizobium sp. BR 314]|uniref:GCG_CRPN prefix-to-repeats domain-containing protein n=1 Tax=Rhizobium sp. BR 314 TaxID=3040013 RepID=UPI0039BFE54F